MDEDSEFTDFIREKIGKAGGSAQIKYLFQFLSSFKNTSIRTQGELMRYIRKRSDIFQVDSNANIRLQASSDYMNEESTLINNKRNKQKEELPTRLQNAEGIVIKLHPTFGFISLKHPFKTIVYFTPSSFGEKNITLFADFPEIEIGTKLHLDAVRGNEDHYSKYRAYKVWVPQKKEKNNPQQIPNSCAPNSRKNRETGLYDPVVSEGEGKIFKLFPNYGFITIEDDKNNTVFFYKNHISNYENVVDLTKALKIGDLVEFKAVRSSMKNIKARWSATQVWIKKSSSKVRVNSNSNKNGPKAEDDSPKEDRYVKKISGKIFPHSKGTVIKFGNNYEKLADADSSLFYMLGAKVQDVSWEFSDGDNVLFDAVKIKSYPGWKATLVWTGERPRVVLPPELGDFSEYSDEPDNIPDSVSCISKSSNNSAYSDVSNKSFRKPISRSSGYSSLKNSQENINQPKKSKFGNSNGIRKFEKEFEDLSDTASCYSRSSNVSSEGGYRFANNRNKKRNNSNYHQKSPNKSKKKNDSNCYNKSTFEGRTFAASHAGTFSKPRKERFQSHMEFTHSDLTNSKTNIADDNQSTLSDSSKDGLKFLRKKVIEQTYTNWGDSPYPDEENGTESVSGEKETNSFSDREPSPSGNSIYDSNTTDCEDKEIYSSNDELSDDEQNEEHLAKVNQKEQTELLKNDDSSKSDSEEQTPKKASITRFREIQGSVTKVYCKYANISSPKLLQAANFFWSDFYMNGTLVSNSGVDDLREVLKEGNILKFNCYQIINDEGHCFIKVTMVWRGEKPNIVEMTPKQFISEVNLSVTLHEDSICDYVEDNDPPSISQHSQSEDDDVDLPIKKFLTAVSDSEEEEVENENQNSDSVKDTLPSNCVMPSSPSDNKSEECGTLSVRKKTVENESDVAWGLNKNQLIVEISKIISSNASKADVNNTSSKILDFLCKSGIVDKFSTITETAEMESQTEIDQMTMISSVQTHNKNEKVELTDTEVQTIFTGEVIGKSIFNE